MQYNIWRSEVIQRTSIHRSSIFERVGTFDAHLRIEVLYIDVKQRIAKLSLIYRPMDMPPVSQ